jgi:hypothetical protein
MATSPRASSPRRVFLIWLAIAAVVTACASLPLARPVTSISQIAGKWQGPFTIAQGTQPATTTINPDGTYSTVLGNQTFTGKITLIDGKLRGRGDQTGNTGTWSLHEGEGKRVLVYANDDGRITGEMTPAK